MAQLVDRLNVIANKLGSNGRGKTIEDAVILIENTLNGKDLNNKAQSQSPKNVEKRPKPVKTEAKESFFNPTTESNDKE
jgi:hypothetical protein